MNTLQLFSVCAAFAIVGAADAQTPTAQEQTQPASSGATTPGTTDPRPSTDRTEGTAADRTPPGATPTRSADPGTVNPVPATSRTEGTAADHTPPGETPVRGAAASQAPEQVTSRMAAVAGTGMLQDRRGSKLIGLSVQSTDGKTIGEVKDLVIDPAIGKITHAILSHGGTAEAQKLTAVPWSSVRMMLRRDVVVVEKSHLAQAPNLAGAWPELHAGSWSRDADRYWGSATDASDEPTSTAAEPAVPPR
jgi:sporulation protein YlmC with PRC-barrel domain